MKPYSAALAMLSALVLLATPAFAASGQSGYEAGVAARMDGRPDEARRLLTAWLAEHPDDVDARLQLALADRALGRNADARAGFEAVLKAAPDYADAREGLASLDRERANGRHAGEAFAVIEGAVSDLSGGARDWTEVAGEIEAPAGQATIGARAAYYRRFGVDDVELTGRVGLHPSDDLWLRAHVSGTPKADFRPEIDLGGGLDLRLANRSTVLLLDAAWQRFPLQEVVTINPGVVQYLPGDKGWITFRGIGTVADGGKLQVGASLRGDYVPVERWRLFAGVSNGPDTDLGVVTRVTSLFGGVEAPVSGRVSMIGSLAREWRNAGSDRTEFRVALKVGL